MTINLSNFLHKEVTVTLRDGRTITGTLTAFFGKVSPLMEVNYLYFMGADIEVVLTWTNTGRWDNWIESEYDITSIVETSPKMNTKQLLQSIKDTEAQLEKLKKQLETPTIQEAKVADTLEDGSIVIKKENGLALVVAPKSTEVQCQWTKEFPEVYSKLTEEGFIPSQWFVPSVEQLQLAYKVIPDEFNKEWYWTSSEDTASSACRVLFTNGSHCNCYKSNTLYVRAFRCISY